MKPTKNRVFCRDCERTKMLFETEKKAENFIKFNKDEIEAESGYGPQRSYYCLFCGGWHITSIKAQIGPSKKEQIFEKLTLEKSRITTPKSTKVGEEEVKNKLIAELESLIENLDDTQKEKVFSERVKFLKNEIELMPSPIINSDIEKVKLLRQNLEIVYIVRKKFGFQNIVNKAEELRKIEIEEWRIWAEKRGYT